MIGKNVGGFFRMKKYYTSESVTEGHPDKICDRISDAILDEFIRNDPMSRVACETSITTGLVLVMGEITSKASVDIQQVVQRTIHEIGYTTEEFGFNVGRCSIIVAIDEQSKDIAQGVDNPLEYRDDDNLVDKLNNTGAGDQGMMFGYATNETPNYMPYSIDMAHKLSRQLTLVRKGGLLKYLGPDGKTQVTVEYDKFDRPKRIDTIVISAQHKANVYQKKLVEDIKRHVIDPIIPYKMVDKDTKVFINPTGKFVVGGPRGDSGLTGRKIIVDTYGGVARHGGGAFSGKDCTKVDRSAAYAARYVAKNIVAAGLADKCEVQLSYAIGLSTPTSIYVETFDTQVSKNIDFEKVIYENFDLSPKGIIEMLDLRRPIYEKSASYGHFGRTDIDFPWEKEDKVGALKKYLC